MSTLSHLPLSLRHFLGHRPTPPSPSPREQRYKIHTWSFIGAFAGLAILQLLFGRIGYFIERRVPAVVASYGASAVLCYGAIETPLAQPRALVLGHVLSATSAISIVKLFALLGPTRYASLQWLAGSLATAVAIVLMQVTDTTHPPAGATALLAAIDEDVRGLGWYLLPVVLLSSVLVLVTALLVNNIQRRYPVFWIQPGVPAEAKDEEEAGGRDGEGAEKGVVRAGGSRASSLTLGRVRNGEGGQV
ncbi:MAG: hypothetical protein Q9182_000837 [Xanthomendoza sp. 2 TL-2023]